MQQCSVKGIKQAESMMREAKACIAVWKRTKAIKTIQEPGMMTLICTLLFSKFDTDVKKDVLNAAGRDITSKDDQGLPNGTRRVLVDFEYMKCMVETVKRVDDANRSTPMDLGSFAEVHDHAEFVRWNDMCAPAWNEYDHEWTPDCAQYQEWPTEGETHRLAAIAEAETSHRQNIDFINGKGGKGGKGKSKGKGKGKKGKGGGKGKGADLTSQAASKPSAAAPGAETR